MVVTVRLFAGMRKYLPDPDSSTGDFELSVKDDSTVRTVVQRLQIPDAVPKTVLVNRIYAELDRPLEDGDVISLLQPIAGG